VSSIDYEALVSQLVFLLQSCRFQLLELRSRTGALLLGNRLPVSGGAKSKVVRLRLSNLEPSMSRVPTVKIGARSSVVAHLVTESKPFGTVDIVQENSGGWDLSSEWLRGVTSPFTCTDACRSRRWSLGKVCGARAEPARAGVSALAHGAPHTYSNPTDRHQTFCAWTVRPLRRHDENTWSTGAPAPVQPEPGGCAAEAGAARFGGS